MNNFHNVKFPLSLAFGASGGPVRRTDIVQLASGAEHRNNPHRHSRRRYNAAAGIKSLDDVQRLIAFFEARQGQLHSFRFTDTIDFKSCAPSEVITSADQFIGEGDGQTRDFQLVKTYADAAGSYKRAIFKPVVETVIAQVDGVPTSVTVNAENGTITFLIAPSDGAAIHAGFAFDVPVRFDTDHLNLTLESFGAGEIASIPLMEVQGDL